ncbi:DUF1758 domain-containing protein [Caerostris extrusa]|uniref:DUF1758 domain-containing protein n=1 Tax=Caerostris extrusa TaxID=172846 RepID=A0AAV4MZB6_CAEEX|nr:DUF1758 domain-containing protein [Caerostris extrusa]
MSAASLVATKEINCVFCRKSHESKECFLARSWTLEERLDKLRKLKCCLRCLKPGHFARDCKHFVQCHLCKRSHPIVLCPDIQGKKCGECSGYKRVYYGTSYYVYSFMYERSTPYDLNG